MSDLSQYMAAVAPHLWEGRGSVSEVHAWYGEIRHPEFPLVLNFQPKTEAGRRKVSVAASLPNDVGGSHHLRRLGETTPRRTFSAIRFDEAPQKVAQEIEHFVSGPAVPLCLKALKAVADRHALEHGVETMARDLAARHGLRISEWGESFHMHDPVKRFDPGAWSTIRIDKSGYIELQLRSLHEAKFVELIDWLCRGGTTGNPLPDDDGRRKKNHGRKHDT